MILPPTISANCFAENSGIFFPQFRWLAQRRASDFKGASQSRTDWFLISAA
jgi:hypothetical protein